MEIRILGPVGLWINDQRLDLGSPKERCLFAILTVNANRPVDRDLMIDHLWGEHPPGKARANLYSYTTRLRTRVQRATEGAARIVHRDHGYVLEIDPDTTDLHRFERLRDQANAIAESGEAEQAAGLMGEAMQLWRGEPLHGLSGAWVERTRTRLAEQRYTSLLRLAELELMIGRYSEVIAELSPVIDENPFDETPVELLMRALYGRGRSGQALDVYNNTVHRLADELGVKPSASLRDLHERMSAGTVDRGPVRDAAAEERPNTLPRPVSDFGGRDEETAALLAAADPATSGSIHVLSGMPGVGKTALAVHVAHALTERYPDAQLFLDLRGHDTGGRPMDPGTALVKLLRRLGIAPENIPALLDDRADLWRATLANRRVLVVLDDAIDQNQIRYLLPGVPRSMVIITTRHRLTGLDGVRSHELSVLSDAESARLVRSIVGAERSRDEEALSEVVRLCGALPMALWLAAARLRDRPARALHDLVAQLTRTDDRLGVLRAGDRAVTTAFELSYRDLTPDQRQAFRRLSHHRGLEFTAGAAAAILSVETTGAEHALDDLLDRHLLDEPERGRFRYHDLLREFAQRAARSEDSELVHVECARRLVRYYLATAQQADHVLRPYARSRFDEPTGVRTPQIPSAVAARELLEAELPGMLDIARDDRPEIPALAHALADFLDTTGRWTEAEALHNNALAISERANDPAGGAAALLNLTVIQLRIGEIGEGLRLAEKALGVYRTLRDSSGEGDALDRIGQAHQYSARPEAALDSYGRAQEAYERAADPEGRAQVLAHSGITLCIVGRYDQGLERFRAANLIYREICDQPGEAETFVDIGEVQRRLGRYEEALQGYEQAIVLAGDAFGPQKLAICQFNVATIRHRQGRISEALDTYRHTLGVWRMIGDRHAEAETLNEIGIAYKDTARFNEALIHHQKALSVAAEIGSLLEQCRARRLIGEIRLETGHPGEACGRFEETLRLAEALGDPFERASTLVGFGRALGRTRGPAAARPYLSDAIAIFDELKVPEANETRALLHDFGAAGA